MKTSTWVLIGGFIFFAGRAVFAGEPADTNNVIKTEHAKSNAIESIEYDDKSKVLILTFKRGTYRYDEVPVEIYEGLTKSESQGTYFKENIRGQFKTSKVKTD